MDVRADSYMDPPPSLVLSLSSIVNMLCDASLFLGFLILCICDCILNI